MRWWKKLFSKKKRCDHRRNFYSHQYRLPDGTPMSHFHCYDCGYTDHGHVYAEEWPTNKIVDTFLNIYSDE